MESSPLLPGAGGGLSWVMAALCIIDMFGVFPVVALPRPIIDCGWIGFPLALFVICLQIYTAGLLGKCWLIAESLEPRIIEQSRCPYAAIAELCFGRVASACVSLLLNLTLFGGGVPNLLVASQMLQLVGLKESNYGVNVSFCYWLLILGIFLCPMMWLGSPKDMKFVAVTSCVTVLAVASLTWSCMLLDATEFVHPPPPPINWEAVAVAYGILAFQFDIHPMILTVQVDMAQKQKLGSAILAAFAVSGSLFLVTTALASWRYGTLARHNLLQGLPGNAMLYVTIVLVTLQICLSLVVGGSPLFQDIEDKLGLPTAFGWRRCVLRSSVMMAAVLVAEMVPRFDLVMGLLGGALTGPLMFVFPPLFYLRLSAMRLARDRRDAMRAHQAALYHRGQYKQPPYSLDFGYTELGSGKVVYPNQTYDAVSAERPFFEPVERPAGAAPVKSRHHAASVLRARGLATEDAVDEDWLSFEPVLPSAEEPPYAFVGRRSADFGQARLSSVDFGSSRLSVATKVTSAAIIVLGMLATVAATYFTLRDTLQYARLTPPCFP